MIFRFRISGTVATTIKIDCMMSPLSLSIISVGVLSMISFKQLSAAFLYGSTWLY